MRVLPSWFHGAFESEPEAERLEREGISIEESRQKIADAVAALGARACFYVVETCSTCGSVHQTQNLVRDGGTARYVRVCAGCSQRELPRIS